MTASERRHWLLSFLLVTSAPAWPAITKSWETAIPNTGEDAPLILDATGSPRVITKTFPGRLRYAALDRGGNLLALGDFPAVGDAESRVPAAAAAASDGGAISCGASTSVGFLPGDVRVDGLAVRFSAAGSPLWSKVLGDAELGLCGLHFLGGCTSTTGALFGVGTASPLLPFPGLPSTCNFIPDNFKAFILRLDELNGAVTALKTFSSISDGTSYAAMASSGTAVYALGVRSGNMILDRYDTDLNIVWTATAPTTGLTPVSISVSSRGEIAALGQRGTLDARVTRFSASGSLLGEAIIPFPESSGVALTGAAGSYVSGRRNPERAALAGVTPADTVTVEFEDPAARRYLSVAVDESGDIFTTAETFGDVLVTRFSRQGAAQNVLSVVLQPPSVTPGTATQVQVTLTDASGNPVADKDVTFTVEPVPTSGGHDHGGSRPVGVFSGAGIVVSSTTHGRTGPDGKLTATYTASPFGGQESIKVHVTDAPNQTASVVLDVRMPGLLPLLTAATYIMDGGTCQHHGPAAPVGCSVQDRNHFGEATTNTAIAAVAVDWLNYAGSARMLEVNDMSLELGGGFDVGGGWLADIVDQFPADRKRCNTTGHCEHRDGRAVDLQVKPNLSPGALSIGQQQKLRNIILLHGGRQIHVEGSHWHVRF